CLTLAEAMRMEAKRYPKRLVAIARAEAKPTEGRPEGEAMSAAEGGAELVRELDLSKTLRDDGIEKSDYTTIVRDAGSPEQAADNANNRKVTARRNRLAEHTPDRKLIQEYSEEYLKLLDVIQSEKIQGTISVKPSQIGLALEAPLFKSLLSKILEKAEGERRF